MLNKVKRLKICEFLLETINSEKEIVRESAYF